MERLDLEGYISSPGESHELAEGWVSGVREKPVNTYKCCFLVWIVVPARAKPFMPIYYHAMDCSLPDSSVMDSLGKNAGVGCFVPSPGDLPDPRVESAHLLCLLHWQEWVLTANTTWEALDSIGKAFKTGSQDNDYAPARRVKYWSSREFSRKEVKGAGNCSPRIKLRATRVRQRGKER